MPGHVEFEFSFARNTPQPSRRGDSLRILVAGDFRGAARAAGEQAIAKPLKIDIDNFGQRFGALAPAVDVTDARGDSHHIVFDSLDAFHPDEIFAKVDAFREAPATSARPQQEEPAESPAEQAADEGDQDTFTRLLGQPVDAPKKTRAKGMLDSFIKNLVDDDAVSDDAHSAARSAGAAAAHSEQMRAILHAATFQRLEATWRGLYELISELETGEELSVHLLDVSEADFGADLDRDDFKDCDLFRMLVSEDYGRFGGQAWHVIACDCGIGSDDMRRLGNLGAIAAAAGGVVLADTGLLAGDDDSGDAAISLKQLRSLPVAEHIGLVAPRILVRLPYGAKSDPVDCFDFEECSGRPQDDELLWGSAAMLLARCLGRVFLDQGWRMSPGGQITIADRPAYVFSEDGERRLANVAQQCLSDSEAEALLDRGVMAVVAQRDGNRLLLPRVQSIAEPARGLRGAWS